MNTGPISLTLRGARRTRSTRASRAVMDGAHKMRAADYVSDEELENARHTHRGGYGRASARSRASSRTRSRSGGRRPGSITTTSYVEHLKKVKHADVVQYLDSIHHRQAVRARGDGVAGDVEEGPRPRALREARPRRDQARGRSDASSLRSSVRRPPPRRLRARRAADGAAPTAGDGAGRGRVRRPAPDCRRRRDPELGQRRDGAR